MYSPVILGVLVTYILLILSNSVLSKRLRTNRSLQLLLLLVVFLFAYNKIHVGFLMLAIMGVTLLSIDKSDLSFDAIMNSFGFNPQLFTLPSIQLPTLSNPFSSLTSSLNLDAPNQQDATSEAESEFDDNVSDIDPNDYIAEMDATVNNDIDNLVNNYLQEDTPPLQSQTHAPPSQLQQNSQTTEEHLTSDQIAQMFSHL